ncbi:MAG: adenosylcobinamide-phosphate synthase CbiB [Thermodesulfobacteriota bacterium]
MLISDLIVNHSLPIVLLSAYLLDLLVGDPLWLPHPVRWMGRYISFLERGIRSLAKNPVAEKVGGVVLFLAVVLTVFLLSWSVLKFTATFSLPLSLFLSIYFTYTALAVRSLHQEAGAVIKVLERGTIEEARKRLSFIVGRDTENLTEEEIYSAVTETVAENTSDGIVAPLFYLAIGGPALALAYKAVNTLDSMVGYKDDRYRHLGWFSARMDDFANYIPSRLTAFLMIAASLILSLDWRGSTKVVWRDGRSHSSPNAGYPEATTAGALGVRLGGGSWYSGRYVERPFIGETLTQPGREAANGAIRLMYTVAILMIVMILFVSLII